MSWRFRAALSLFLIALMAQIFAPIGASLAMAQMFDARDLAPVCVNLGQDGKATSDPAPSRHHGDDECCGFCQLADGPPATLHPALIGLSNPPALYRVINRYSPDQLVSIAFIGDQTRARAPPQGS